MNTYTKFLVKTYIISFLNVFFIFFCLIYILNLLTELEFFKVALKSIKKPGVYSSSLFPHQEAKDWQKNVAKFRRLKKSEESDD